jgi:cystathionine gamma-lyase
MDAAGAARWGFRTRAVHVGSSPDATTGAVIPPLSLSTTFAQRAPASTVAGYDYSRSGNPTRDGFEAALAAVEAGGREAAAFASGLAATDTLLRALPTGSRVLAMDDVYGGTRRLLTRVLDAGGALKISYADLSDTAQARALIASTSPDLVWLESPTNPTLKVADVAAVAEALRQANPSGLLVCDNTFLSPAGQSPLLLGADFVVHSVTKYIGGHSDVVMGAVIGGHSEPALALFPRLRFLQNATGAIPSPFDCFLAHRGLKTLALRLQAASSSAAAIAAALERSPHVSRVSYPGLASHPQHALSRRQACSFGAMVAFWLRPPQGVAAAAAVEAFLQSLTLFALAESLGGVESLAEAPTLMTHASVPAAERLALGLDDALVRLSVGIEETEDLVADVEHALEKAAAL